MFFEYGEYETEYLKSRDERMSAAIDRIGHIYREVDEDIFASIVRSIIGQQISTKAQLTICDRLQALIGELTSENIGGATVEELRSVGLSARKTEYILDACDKIQSGKIDVGALYDMTDDEVTRVLTGIKGVGVWTAEMIMLFCMRRGDIFSYSDFGIKKGLRLLYQREDIDRESFDVYRRLFSPCGSVAGLYLWEIAGGAMPELVEPIFKRKKTE